MTSAPALSYFAELCPYTTPIFDPAMYSQRRPPSSRPRNGYTQRSRGPSSSGSGRNFESNGPANFRVRGKPIQIHDKYVQLARESAANGDKVLTENLLQHAEHYLRMQSSDRDKSSPQERSHERSQERSNENAEGEGDEGYRRFAPAPRSGAQRRWAVAPEGPAHASSEPTSSGEQDAEQPLDSADEQAQVEQRRPLAEGGLATSESGDARADEENYD